MSDDPSDQPPSAGSAYAAAGVDIDAQDRALERVKGLARDTFTPGVLTEIGSFGGLFHPDLSGLEEPVLVASADGVGTKLVVARRMGDYSTVGRDLVNHCVNDILVQGARPLFFLDYVGAGVLEPDAMVDLVSGVAAGCRASGCALLGGETAEMPGFYGDGDYELVGFILGLVDRGAILPGERVRPGDVLVGLPSAGLHTNGYSLARHVFFERLGLGPGDPVPGAEDRRPIGRVLLDPHLSYLPWLEGLLDHPGLHGLAHVTGGGLTDNLPRILPPGTRAAIRLGSWTVPEVFRLIREHGEVGAQEMRRVFNLGIGMVLVVDPGALDDILDRLEAAADRFVDAAGPTPPGFTARPTVIGTVEEGSAGVTYLEDPSGEGSGGS